jgi:hypothetical protein
LDLGALPGLVADLLFDIPLGVAALEGIWEAVEDVARLLEPFEEAPWSFWLTLIALTAVAYELARRDMTRLAADPAQPPDLGDPTAA